MNKPVNALWCLSSNVGDNITPYLIQKITELPTFYVDKNDPRRKILGCGSILNWSDDLCYVWGSGASSDNCPAAPKNIFLLRGPLSRQIVIRNGGSAPECYGDPALLLPSFYHSAVTNKYRLGIIPHYIEQDVVYGMFKYPDVVIDVFQPVEKFIDQVCACETIISSSLHGLIIADAYGIPSRRMVLTHRILGDGTKYLDYYASLDIKPNPPLSLEFVLSSNPIELAKSTELNKISSNFKFTIYDALFRAINAMEDGTKP